MKKIILLFIFTLLVSLNVLAINNYVDSTKIHLNVNEFTKSIIIPKLGYAFTNANIDTLKDYLPDSVSLKLYLNNDTLSETDSYDDLIIKLNSFLSQMPDYNFSIFSGEHSTTIIYVVKVTLVQSFGQANNQYFYVVFKSYNGYLINEIYIYNQ